MGKRGKTSKQRQERRTREFQKNMKQEIDALNADAADLVIPGLSNVACSNRQVGSQASTAIGVGAQSTSGGTVC